MTNTEYQERRDAILDKLAMAAMWDGFDKAMDTPGKHTNATPDELMAEAKQAIDNLFLELLEPIEPNIYPGLLRSNQEAQNRLRKHLRNTIKGTKDE